jgi:hypothetical protein
VPCYHPLKGYYARKVNPETGKRSVVFNSKEGFYDYKVNLPCGRCIGCRLERSRQWAVRCVHEASLHEQNCFITLTFDDKNLEPGGSLVKADFQNFMKRLRKRFFGNSKGNVRYFHCGEYGEKLGRPHHHAALFGLDFPDRLLWSTKGNVRLYRSCILEALWPYGHSTVGDVTFESAAYIARYVTKKITGEMADSHYGGRLPEYCTMSRRPGIAREWFNRYKDDLYPKDFAVIRGKKCKVPKYYNRCYELTNPSEYGDIRASRVCQARGNLNFAPERMAAGEVIQKARFEMLKREYEHV